MTTQIGIDSTRMERSCLQLGVAFGKFLGQQNVAQFTLLVGLPTVVSLQITRLVLFDGVNINARALVL